MVAIRLLSPNIGGRLVDGGINLSGAVILATI